MYQMTLVFSLSLVLFGCSKAPTLTPWTPTREISVATFAESTLTVNGKVVEGQLKVKPGAVLVANYIFRSNKPFAPKFADDIKSLPVIYISFQATGKRNEMVEVVRGAGRFEGFPDSKSVEFSAEFTAPTQKGKVLLETMLVKLTPIDGGGFKTSSEDDYEHIHRVLVTID